MWERAHTFHQFYFGIIATSLDIYNKFCSIRAVVEVYV